MSAILTYRRDQRTYRPGLPCPDQLIGGIIFCGSDAGRRAWIKRLHEKHPGRFNHFVCFVDVQSPFALMFGFAEWNVSEKPYVIW
jgi:hypothetical protein